MRPDSGRGPMPRDRARERRRKQIQRRRLVALACLLVLIVIIIVLVATCGGSDDSTSTTSTSESTGSTQTTSTTLVQATYVAELTGAEAVPPVETEATGTLLLSYDPTEDTLTFSLGVDSLTDPTVAAIFEGAPGEEGAAVVNLFAGPAEEGAFTGTLAEGTLTADDLTGSLEGGTLGDLIALIEEGNAYVSVGNKENPVEAIRGEIKAD